MFSMPTLLDFNNTRCWQAEYTFLQA